MPFDPQFWTETLREITAGALTWLPVLAGALLWLLIGWIVARIVQTVVNSLLRRLGFDRIADRAGASEVLRNAGLTPSASRLLARIVYWLILLIFILAAAESLGLQGVVDTLDRFISYLPSVLASVLILLFGSLLANVVGDTIGALASQAGVAAGVLLGQIVQYVLLIFVIILTLGQLGIETTLLTTVTVVLITATALALALAFGLGSRDLARNIMAGFHVRELFDPGQQIQVRQHRGRIVEIGAVKSTIATADGRLSLPNTYFVSEEVTVVDLPVAGVETTGIEEGQR